MHLQVDGTYKTKQQLRNERNGLLMYVGLICLVIWAVSHFCGDTVPTYHAPSECTFTYAHPC